MTEALLKLAIAGFATALLLMASAAFAIYLPVTRDDNEEML
jgi:hypothetical protein